MSPVTLSQKVQYATLVFDAVQREESGAVLLRQQLEQTFDSKEYVYFTSESVDILVKNAMDTIHTALLAKRKDGSLKDTGHKFLFVFYEKAESLTQERLWAMKRVVEEAQTKYDSGMSGFIQSVICIDKIEQDTEAAMNNMLTAAKWMEEQAAGGTYYHPSMLLIATDPLDTSSVSIIRGAVRYLYLLSRDNALSGILHTERRDRLAFAVMSEFDVEGFAEAKERIVEIEKQLAPKRDFPTEVLKTNFDRIKEHEEELLKQKKLPPLDAVCIPHGIFLGFWKKETDENRERTKELEETLRWMARRNVWDPHIEEMEKRGDSLCADLLEGIYPDELGKVSENLSSIHKENSIAKPNTLESTRNMGDLKKAMAGYLNAVKNEYCSALSGEILRVLRLWLEKTITAQEIADRKERLQWELNQLKAGMYPDVADTDTYLQNIHPILKRLMGKLGMSDGIKVENYMLISSAIAQDWGKRYQSKCKIDSGSTPVTDPYDCGTLEGQEFRVFRILYFSHKHLESDKHSVFHVKAVSSDEV